jgi:hypothetical protein
MTGRETGNKINIICSLKYKKSLNCFISNLLLLVILDICVVLALEN